MSALPEGYELVTDQSAIDAVAGMGQLHLKRIAARPAVGPYCQPCDRDRVIGRIKIPNTAIKVICTAYSQVTI